MPPIQRILVIGAGELGTQVLLSLAKHRNLSDQTTISVLLRPSTISSPAPSRAKELQVLRSQGISFVPGDITADTTQALTSTFRNYDAIISCTGFAAGPGTQLKLARAVLDAKLPRYIPWQFGIDYDAIGRGSAQELFDEQLDVRDLLRKQRSTRWVIVSTGMFTSFLFEKNFGVVDADNGVVRALGALENRVTVTSPVDIGRITAEVVLGVDDEEGFVNEPVYVAGDTLSYAQLADIVERVTGKAVERKVRTVEAAKEDLAKNPGNGLYKYEVVFGEGRGVAWDVHETWNYKRGIRAQTAEEWAGENLV